METALFVGRFQPLHNGHIDIIQKILKENDKIIIVIGSADEDFSQKNPLTTKERIILIKEAIKEMGVSPKNYHIIPLRDINNINLWVNHLNKHIPKYSKVYTGSELVKKCYKINPTAKIINIKKDKFLFSASDIRKMMIKNENWEKMVHPSTAKLLKKWDIPKKLKNAN